MAPVDPRCNGLKGEAYSGCLDSVKGISGIEYYYLEWKGSEIYSCISCVAYEGAFTGCGKGWSRASAPSNAYLQFVVGNFDLSSSGDGGKVFRLIEGKLLLHLLSTGGN